MKIYSQEEFNNFEIVNNIKQCPSGNYKQIKIFGKMCSFGEWCSFGEGCSFGERCSFGEGCSFGKICSFGKMCSFGEWCSFGERCSFGEGCSFGKRCSFGEGCSFENLKFDTHNYFIRINNIGSRRDGCYIFNSIDGLYIRSGCWFGSEAEFIERLKKVHSGNKYQREYLAALTLAKITFEGE